MTYQAIFTSPSGSVSIFQAELAVTPEEQARGLRGRTYLDPNTVMVFPFDHILSPGVSMHGVLIPLDVMCIGADRRVGDVVTVPAGSRRFFSLHGAYKFMVEAVAGTAARHGIVRGSFFQLLP